MNFYLNKYGFCPQQLSLVPHDNVNIIIVIPCYNEPDLISSLQAIYNCTLPSCNIEVIIVINASINESDKIKTHNLTTYKTGVNWAKKHNSKALMFHFILNNNLPKKHAGVGLARKIGMDEAVYRFDLLKKDGIIVCFDADSKCDPNYLVEIEKHFVNSPKTPGCSIHYEHPIEGVEFEQSIYNGIINYELFLRYYNLSLQYAKLPFAFQTVGSSMAVRSSIYQKQGGMNKRKAGEDFYFIHKIIALGGFTNLTKTKVIPSPRISDRVPFGTGKAIGDWIESEEETYSTYDFRIFEIIKEFVEIIPTLEKSDLDQTKFSTQKENQQFIHFLIENDFNMALTEIRKNASNSKAFLKRFFIWFNAFRVLKLVHYLRDNQYQNKDIFDLSVQLARHLNFYNNQQSPKELLQLYRKQEQLR